MSSADTQHRLADDERRILLQLARSSIEAGLLRGAPLAPDHSAYTGELCEHRACFVTLRMSDKALRGCIGSTEAVRSLVADVADNAWAAAFRDPRFDPLCRDEFDDVHVHISILSPLEPLSAGSEQELLEVLRPGIDGLFVREGSRRGTLLPAVWDMMPDAERFLCEVRRKAGLPGDYWSASLSFFRFTAESFD